MTRLRVTLEGIAVPEEIFETSQPTTEPKPKNWPKIILIAVLGSGLLATAACAGYWYGTENAKLGTQTSPSPTPSPSLTPTVGDETRGWNVYKDPLGKFEFSYPPEWNEISQCKFGELCVGSSDLQENLIPGGEGGGRYVVSQGRLFRVSRTEKTTQMRLENACHPGGPLYVRSCEPTVLSGKTAMKRVEGDPENGTTIIVLTDDYHYLVGMDYTPTDQEVKRVLDQILSTFKFL